MTDKTKNFTTPWKVNLCIPPKGSKDTTPRLEIVEPVNERSAKVIALVYASGMPSGKANARLIAAAPEMYQMLRNICDYDSDAAEGLEELLDRIDGEGE